MSHLSTPDLRGTLLCRCGTEQTTSRNGTVRKHDGCAFSGRRLSESAIDKRQVALSDRLRASYGKPSAFTPRALGIIQ